MGWKDWSYAKKGFVIGLVYSIYSIVVVYLLQYLNTALGYTTFTESWYSFIFIILSITIWPYIGIAFIGLPFLIFFRFDMFISRVMTGILAILIFTLIGWIVGKIKSK